MKQIRAVPFETSSQHGGVLLILLGLVIAAAGLLLSFIISVLLFDQFQTLGIEPAVVSPNQFLYEGLWLLFSLSIAVLGLSLMVSGMAGRRHDIVPGPTLYVMGAAMMAIALMMAMYGQVLHAVLAAIAGLTLMVIEWYYDVV